MQKPLRENNMLMILRNWQDTWDSMSWLSPGQVPPCWHEVSNKALLAHTNSSILWGRKRFPASEQIQPCPSWISASTCPLAKNPCTQHNQRQFHWLRSVGYHVINPFLTRQMIPECQTRVNIGFMKIQISTRNKFMIWKNVYYHQN